MVKIKKNDNTISSNNSANDDLSSILKNHDSQQDQGLKVKTPRASKVIEKKKKIKKVISSGRIYIYSSKGNTLISITDKNGNVIVFKTAGSCGNKGTKKGTPFAAQQAAEQAGRQAQEKYAFKEAEVFLSGTGPGKDAALRAMNAIGITYKIICYKSSVAHNGCRASKGKK